MARPIKPSDDAQLDRIKRCYDAGLSVPQISAAENVSKRVLRRWLALAGVTMRPRGLPKGFKFPAAVQGKRAKAMRALWRTEAYRTAQTARIRAFAEARVAAADACEIPAWVPDALRDGYRRRMRSFGETQAARWARRAKRELHAFSEESRREVYYV